jgi:hypothetical protein
MGKTIGLAYLGVDIVLDAARGPVVLEANARPGLAIQTANTEGLLHSLRTVDLQIGANDPQICETAVGSLPLSPALSTVAVMQCKR